MKLEDLMTNDLVQITEPDDYHRYIGTVKIINSITGYITVFINDGNLHDVFIDDLQPIPLTVEILEKNEFELDKELTKEDENKWYKHYFKDPLPNINGIVALYISFDEEDQNPELSYVQMVDSLPFKYVHQLQHILKDLQIEKEVII